MCTGYNNAETQLRHSVRKNILLYIYMPRVEIEPTAVPETKINDTTITRYGGGRL